MAISQDMAYVHIWVLLPLYIGVLVAYMVDMPYPWI
jgi:hypothetical protein